MPLISVVIPLHNKASHIERAIHSVFAQTEQDFELIVVNDASTDGGEKIVARMMDSRIKLLHNTVAGPGGHSARNRGIKAASSDLIAFLDADDSWEPAHIEVVLRLRNRFPLAGAYATAYKMHDVGGQISYSRYTSMPSRDWEGTIDNYFDAVLLSQPLLTSAISIPKKVFLSQGFFPEGVPRGGDVEMWFRIAIKYPIAYSGYVGTTWFRDSENRVCSTVPISGTPYILKSLRRGIVDPSLDKKLIKKIKVYHDFLVSYYIHEAFVLGRTEIIAQLLDQYLFRKREFYLYALLSMLPKCVVRSIVVLRRSLSVVV